MALCNPPYVPAGPTVENAYFKIPAAGGASGKHAHLSMPWNFGGGGVGGLLFVQNELDVTIDTVDFNVEFDDVTGTLTYDIDVPANKTYTFFFQMYGSSMGAAATFGATLTLT